MSSKNTHTQYGSVAKCFHWLVALLIISAFGLGIIGGYSDVTTDAGLARTVWIYSLHKTIGISIFLLAVARICWTLTQAKPAPLHPERKLETFAAEAAHWILYISMIIVPLSGWLHHASVEGYAPILWPLGQSLPFVPKSAAMAEFYGSLHYVFTKVLGITFLAHLAGALKHHFIDQDNTLRRMLPGQVPAASPAQMPHTKTPMITAFAIYVAALGVGSALGLQSHDKTAPQLDQVASDWVVNDGTISINFIQFGGQVSGTFKDWTASIEFDEQTQTGSVDVTIAIGSVDLGTLTGDALSEPYFSADVFPQAQFSGPIVNTGAGLVVDGQLTLRGKTVPVQLPFDLNITDGVATVTASAQLDRRNYNIGDNQSSDDSLGFAVDVTIALSAQKNAQP